MKILKPIAWLLPVVLLSSGCFGTVSPTLAKAKRASMSAIPDPTGNYESSGVWGWTTNRQMVIDYIGRDTYNSLIARGWGAKLTPPITNQDYGITRYTNNPVEPLRGLDGKMTKPVANSGELFLMNPVAQEAWPTMTALSRAPAAHPP